MTAERETVSDRIGAQVRAVRTRHGWTQEDLAGRCAALGAAHLTGSVIYDIESGRRDAAGQRRRQVSADDWLALALALDVAPVHLAVPLADDQPCPVTDVVSEPAGIVRQWLRGHHPLKGTDRRMFYSYVPERELARAEQIQKLIEVSPDLFKMITESEDE